MWPASARGDGFEVWPSQPGEQAIVAGEHHGGDGARVEVGSGEEVDFGEHRVGCFLSLVDEQQRAHAGVVEMGETALAQVQAVVSDQ